MLKRNVVLILFQDPIIGGSLLLTYTTGYVTPLLLAASFAGALQVITSSVVSFDILPLLLPAHWKYHRADACIPARMFSNHLQLVAIFSMDTITKK